MSQVTNQTYQTRDPENAGDIKGKSKPKHSREEPIYASNGEAELGEHNSEGESLISDRAKYPPSSKSSFNWLMRFAIFACVLIIIIIILAVVVTTLPSQNSNYLSSCPESFNADEDYFPQKISQLNYGLNVSYFLNYKRAYFSSLASQEKSILVQCETPSPEISPNEREYSVAVGAIAVQGIRPVKFLEVSPHFSALNESIFHLLTNSFWAKDPRSSISMKQPFMSLLVLKRD